MTYSLNFRKPDLTSFIKQFLILSKKEKNIRPEMCKVSDLKRCP